MTTAQNLSTLGQLFASNALGYRNKIINGSFENWQRGTALGSAANVAYLADRWFDAATGSTTVLSQQAFSLGQTAVPYEPKFFHRAVVTSVAGAGNGCYTLQKIEGVRTLAGQTATLSFWAKADATKNIAIEFVQSFGTGGSPSADVNSIGITTKTLTTTWQYYTVTVTLPSIIGKTLGTNANDSLGVYFWYEAGSTYNSRTNSLGQQSGTFDLAQVQLETGYIATPFEIRPPAIELALCKRYCVVYQSGVFVGPASVQGTLNCYVQFTGTDYMRTAPSITHVGGGNPPRVYTAGGTSIYNGYGATYWSYGAPYTVYTGFQNTITVGNAGSYYSEGQQIILSSEL